MSETSREAFYDPAQAADILDMGTDVLRNNAYELHVLQLPEHQRRFPRIYVDSLAADEMWSERSNGRAETMAAFARTSTAIGLVAVSEGHLDARIQAAAQKSGQDMLTGRSIAHILQTQPKTVSRWRRVGELAEPTRYANLSLNSAQEVSDMLAWQRPASLPLQHESTAMIKAVTTDPNERKRLMPTLPPSLKFSDARELLSVENHTMVAISPHIHHFRTTLQSDMRYPVSTLETLRQSTPWNAPESNRVLAASVHSSSPDAMEVMVKNEQEYSQAVDQAFETYGETIPEYVACHLLGVHSDAFAVWRADGRLQKSSPLNRELFDSLYYWHRPAQSPGSDK